MKVTTRTEKTKSTSALKRKAEISDAMGAPGTKLRATDCAPTETHKKLPFKRIRPKPKNKARNPSGYQARGGGWP